MAAPAPADRQSQGEHAADDSARNSEGPVAVTAGRQLAAPAGGVGEGEGVVDGVGDDDAGGGDDEEVRPTGLHDLSVGRCPRGLVGGAV